MKAEKPLKESEETITNTEKELGNKACETTEAEAATRPVVTTRTESKSAAESGGAAGCSLNDELDLALIRISQNFGSMAGTRKLITTIPIKSPNRFDWIFADPDPAKRVAVWILREERDSYLVANEIANSISGEVSAMDLVPTMTRQGTLFLWPIPLPNQDGKINTWSESRREAAVLATQGWVRVASNMDLKAYEVFQPVVAIPPPVFPNLTIGEMVRIAARGRLITSADHPILRRLRGEV